MKKTQRVGAIVKILSDSPNRTFSLNYFCDKLGAAKSSISEDIKTAKSIFAEMELGIVETSPGAGGGVTFVPHISDAAIRELQDELCTKLSDPSRLVGGGFLYTSDVMFDATLIKRVATVFARKFRDENADFVTTIETKGIPVAVMTAYLLNIPLVVIRRESKISEGSTISINYFSGSYDRIQKMSISKRALVPGSKALIIDDFMRGGGSIKGITEILSEFDVTVAGTGVVLAGVEPKKKKISDFIPLLYIDTIDTDEKKVKVFPNSQIF